MCGVLQEHIEGTVHPVSERSNQSFLKEVSPEYSSEGLLLKLKLQYFGHLMQRTDSFERPWSWERLRAGGERDHRGWDGWMASTTGWIWAWANSRSWWWPGRPGVLQSMGSQSVRHDWATKLRKIYSSDIFNLGWSLKGEQDLALWRERVECTRPVIETRDMLRELRLLGETQRVPMDESGSAREMTPER